MLEAWKRVMPPVHFTRLPFALFVLFVDDMFGRGEVELGLLTWLTYHCILRPGEALLARVRDLRLPSSLAARRAVSGLLRPLPAHRGGLRRWVGCSCAGSRSRRSAGC